MKVNSTMYYHVVCDPATIDWVGVGKNTASIFLPAVLKRVASLGEIGADLLTHEIEAGVSITQREWEDALDEAIMACLQLAAAPTPYGVGVEVLDLGMDVHGIAESSGCRWLP